MIRINSLKRTNGSARPQRRNCVARAKETFMEAKKSFIVASTSGSQDKVQDTNVPTEVDPSMGTTVFRDLHKSIA